MHPLEVVGHSSEIQQSDWKNKLFNLALKGLG